MGAELKINYDTDPRNAPAKRGRTMQFTWRASLRWTGIPDLQVFKDCADRVGVVDHGDPPHHGPAARAGPGSAIKSIAAPY